MITRQVVSRFYPAKPLGELAEFLDSKRKPITESDRKPGPFPYYGANGIQGYVDGYIFDEPLLLLAEDGGHFDEPSRGIAYRISGKSWVNNHAHVIRPKSAIDLAFLGRVLENYDVRPFISGTTRSKLTKGQAEKIAIPVPPLPEQRRIAAILDQADELRRKRQKSLSHFSSMIPSIFASMFLTEREAFPEARLEDVVRTGAIVTYGIVQAGEEFPDGVPYIRTGDIVDGQIDCSGLRHTDPAIAERFARSRVQADEIVMSIRATVGTTALVPTALNGANLTQGTARIAPGDRTDKLFLLYFLRCDQTQKWIERQVKGATFREITLTRLRDLPVKLPPLSLQKEFAAKAESVEKLKAKTTAHLLELEALFFSLQHRAFSGELTARQAERELELAG